MTMRSQTDGHELLILASSVIRLTDQRTNLHPPPEFGND